MADAKNPLVFVVDDERTIAATLAAILASAGFAAEAFFNPLEALKAAETRRPDILITDMLMPQLNGVDLAVQVKATWPECRVVLFAGQTETSAIESYANEKGHHFEVLLKPIHPKDLIAAIRAVPA